MSIKSGAQMSPENALQGLDVISAIVALGKNPKALQDMRDDLIEATAISADQKNEALAAAKTILEAKNAQAKLEETKAAHEAQVAADLKDREEARAALTEAEKKLIATRDAFTAHMETTRAEAERQRNEIDISRKSAEERHKEADKKTTALTAFESSLNRREQQITEREKKHEDAVAKFNARKKALAAAAMNVEGD